MRMIFKQRMFSWFDSYDIYDEMGNVLYVVRGQLAWGHCFKIFDANGSYLGRIEERVFSFLPKFEIYLGDLCIGCISKEFSFFTPRFNIDCNGWHVEGNMWEWDYHIMAPSGGIVATVSKQPFNFTDTYEINVFNTSDALAALMLVLAIDAEKCSRDN